MRLYDRTANGAKIATITAQPSSAQPTLRVRAPSFMRSRDDQRDRADLDEGLQPARQAVS